MIIMHVTYQLRPGKSGRAFCDALREQQVISRTRSEEGCRRYEFFLPAETDNQVFLLELWENGETMAAHKKTPQCQTLQAIKAQYVAETTFQQYEV